MRDLRENIKKKIEDTVENAKDLPAQEIKTIQREICKEWLKEEAGPTPGE